MFALASLAGRAQVNNDDQNSDDVYYQSDDNEAAPAPAADQGDQPAPTYQQFYDQLSPEGQWINYPGYGYCWIPNQLPPDFSPYMTGGHWVYTDYGMTWVSDYDWGWACFHYGRWFLDATYGWMWVPGYDWAPAWVTWGYYGDYYCWAPFAPGVIISPHYRPDAGWWHFCDRGHIMDEHWDHYAYNSKQFETHANVRMADVSSHISYISHANTYNQSVFFAGPKAEEIQHYSGHPVTKVAIANTDHAGATHVQGNQLNIYRPNIQRTAKQPAPANVKSEQEVHPNNNGGQPNREVQQPRETQQQHTTQQQPRETQQPRQETQQPARQTQTQDRGFIPTERPAQQPAQHYSAPAQPSYRGGFSPAPSFHSTGGGGGGGGFHGGGGGGRH